MTSVARLRKGTMIDSAGFVSHRTTTTTTTTTKAATVAAVELQLALDTPTATRRCSRPHGAILARAKKCPR